MRYVYFLHSPVVRKADDDNEIFYALRFTYYGGDKDNKDPYYSLCLPALKDTVVLFRSITDSGSLGLHVADWREKGFNFSRINTNRPYAISELEIGEGHVVEFGEMPVDERRIFFDTLRQGKKE